MTAYLEHPAPKGEPQASAQPSHEECFRKPDSTQNLGSSL